MTKVVAAASPEEFLEVVCEKAKTIGEFPAESLRMAKAQVNPPVVLAEQREAGLREGYDLKVRLNVDEAKERMKAFTDKFSKIKL